MSDCAIEYRDAARTVQSMPNGESKILFADATGYNFRTWATIIAGIISTIQQGISPVDEEVQIGLDWAGRNYYDKPELLNVRYRLFRDGILLNKTQWRPSETGGWQLLTLGDQLTEGAIFTIVRY